MGVDFFEMIAMGQEVTSQDTAWQSGREERSGRFSMPGDVASVPGDVTLKLGEVRLLEGGEITSDDDEEDEEKEDE